MDADKIIATHGADIYRVAPFTVSSFSGDALSKLPTQLDPQDSALFLESLKAQSVPELVRTARLWEDQLLERYRIPFFLVRVGDVRASLNSAVTALILYKEAQAHMEPDHVFDEFVASLEAQCASDEEKHRSNWAAGVFNQPWRGTSQYRFPILPRPPDQTPDLQGRWAAMKGQPMEHRYLRHLAIESNLLELTFALTPTSITKLIRDGFEENTIEFLDDSALQDTSIICDILRDTHKALDLVLTIAHDTSKLTVELLYELHAICMKTTRILPIVVRTSTGSVTGGSDSPLTSSEYQTWLETEPQASEVETPASSLRSQPMEFKLKYTNVKLTRQATKKNVVISGPPRVQFCPFDDIVGELGRFVHLARQWLKNWARNPFASAAWLHLVIATIHPFENGNGRVARLIASIPLIRADLPPLCILSDSVLKKQYFESLGRARDNHYQPLIDSFEQSLERSLEIAEKN